MKRHTSISLAFATVLLASQAVAHDHDDNDDDDNNRYQTNGYSYQDDNSRYSQNDDDYRYNGSRHDRYDTAQVVRVEPIYANGYGSTHLVCDEGYRQGYDLNHGYNSNINSGAVVGALVGGVIGNQVGKGDGRVLTTLAGATIGGLIGNNVADHNRYTNNSNRYDDQRGNCHAVSDYRKRDINYRVTYRYHGRNFITVMPYNPGRYVQVRVDRDYRGKQNIVAYRY